LKLDEALGRLPPEWPEELRPRIQAQLRASPRSIVVLDDDPTGTQTVYDTPVLTDWRESSLSRELAAGTPLFYVLTNSRSLNPSEAADLAREAGLNLTAAARKTGRAFSVISRSDSTLRGHYPAEVDALAEALGLAQAPCLLIPFFAEGRRYTLDDVHYVADGDQLIPAAETPFARDASFGYKNSNLRQWVEEKTGGRLSAEAVRGISIETIRKGGPAAVKDLLCALPARSVCVVNAAALRDMEVVVAALLEAEDEGKQFLFRTAASFVQARAGLETRSLLFGNGASWPSVDLQGAGGLVVVGSHVPKSTAQLEQLIKATGMAAVELAVNDLLASERCAEAVRRATAQVNGLLTKGCSVALFTSRELVVGAGPCESLAIGRQVSKALVRVVSGLTVAPGFFVAKGGITSSDLATESLGARRAVVLGQILPGVPVWELGLESRFPGMRFVVFPGNVGGPESLLEVCVKLSGAQASGLKP
jgi:uncharacterized protein YgbK (DUF1537 family)